MICVTYCNYQITADSISAFEKLIEAYGKIADMLPRLDRLGHALANDHNFQNVLALVYSDIVEFHRRAYKFVRRKCRFSTSVTRYHAHHLKHGPSSLAPCGPGLNLDSTGY
jgi:hypothetical protein